MALSSIELSRETKVRLYHQALLDEKRRRRLQTPVKIGNTLNPLAFITDALQQCRGESWRNWRTVLKAAYGLALDDEELEFFRGVAQRDPPGRRVRELWLIVGRRGGKDSVASLIAMECARHTGNYELRPGERPIVACPEEPHEPPLLLMPLRPRARLRLLVK
jgi:hypothetical protein